MIDFNIAISAIRDNNGFIPNTKDSSFYRVYEISNQRPIQVRISNHGTHLWTWDEKAEYAPHRGYNISIVFMSSSKGYDKSNTTVNMGIFKQGPNKDTIKVGTKPNFEVIQYVYDCDLLTPNNITRINQFIQQIPRLKKFIDPMKTNPQKHAKVYRLTPNNVPEIITENNNLENMKTNKIKLTESQLHKVIKESVKKVLKEGLRFDSQYVENKWYNDFYFFYEAFKPSVYAMDDDFVKNRLHRTKEGLLRGVARMCAEEFSYPEPNEDEQLYYKDWSTRPLDISTLPADY